MVVLGRRDILSGHPVAYGSEDCDIPHCPVAAPYLNKACKYVNRIQQK